MEILNSFTRKRKVRISSLLEWEKNNIKIKLNFRSTRTFSKERKESEGATRKKKNKKKNRDRPTKAGIFTLMSVNIGDSMKLKYNK